MVCQISILIIIFFVVLHMFKAVIFSNYCINPKRYLHEWMLIGIAFGVLAYHFEPSELDDLYRYFRLEEFMISKHSIWVWLYPGINNLIIWRLLLGTSVYFNNVHIMPLIAVLFIFLFWGLGIKIIADNHKISYLSICLNFMISLGMVGWLPIFSWIRCTLTYAIVAYVILDTIYNAKKKKYMQWLLLIVCACLLHPSAIFPIGLYFFSILVHNNLKVSYILLFWTLLANVIIQLLKIIPLEYIQLLARGAEGYFYFRRVNDIRLIIVKIIVSILVLLILKQFHYQFKELPVKLVNYLLVLSIFMIGTFRFDEIVNRLGIFFGYMLLPVIVILNRKRTASVVIVDMILLFISIGLNIFSYVSVFSHMRLVC